MIIDTDRLANDGEYKNELRHRSLTDHFFLAELVGYNKFIRHLHQPVADLYFPKNPNLPIEDQDPIKFRMHIDPRHTYKTTMGKVDALQWVCAFPEFITQMFESSTKPLSKAISNNVANFFWKPRMKAATPFQLVWDELVVEKKPEVDEDLGWCTYQHSQLEMDPTVAFTSPQSRQAGWHPWVIHPDDMVDNINSGIRAKDETRKGITETYYTNKNLLRHGGYMNLRGTRYHPFDAYGDQLDRLDPSEWKILIRASMVVKSGERLLPGQFPAADEVELLFPELLPYAKLRSIFMDSYESFMCQQQNDPQGGKISTFGAKLYNSCLVTPDRIPPLGETIICWRFPYGRKVYMSDYAEGAAARIFGGKVYIIDTWRGIYPPSRLAEKIIRECKHHQTSAVMVEALPGSEYMEAHIKNESYRKNVSVRLQWMEFQEDDNTRFSRIAQIEPTMRAGRLLISTDTAKQGELRSQLVHFGLAPENGIVDCISRLASRIPVSVMRQEIEEEEIALQRQRSEDLMSQMVFGQAGIDQMNEEAERQRVASERAWERTNSFGLPDILGGLDG